MIRSKLKGRPLYKRIFNVEAENDVTAKMRDIKKSKSVILKVEERDCIKAGSKSILNKEVVVAGRKMEIKDARYNAKKGEIEIKFK